MIPQNVLNRISIAVFLSFLIVSISCNPEKVLIEYQLSITSPDGNSHWMGGETHAISWKSNLEDKLKIELLHDGSVYTTINDKTINSGNYNWTIPDDIPYGKTYTIKISDTGITGKSWTSNEFKLSEKPGTTALIQYNQINYKLVKIGFLLVDGRKFKKQRI